MSSEQLMDAQANYIAETFGISIEAARGITRELEKKALRKKRRR